MGKQLERLSALKPTGNLLPKRLVWTAQVLMPKFKMAAEVILQHDLSFNAFLTVFIVTTFDLMTFVPAFAVQTATWIWLNRLSD